MPANKNKLTTSQITVLDRSDLLEKPSSLPTAAAVRSLVKNLGIGKIDSIPNLRPGFVLNAHNPVAPGKAKLIVPVNGSMRINDTLKPYYYFFNQWEFAMQSFDGIWGKVTIKFERRYLIQDGIVFIRLGGYLSSMMGDGYHISDGKSTKFYRSKHRRPEDHGKFISETIPVYVQKSANRSALLDITVTSRLASWKFFDAVYNPFK